MSRIVPYFEQQDKVLAIPLMVILLVDIAKQRQIEPDKLLKGSQLFSSDLSDPNLRISHQQFARIVSNVNKYLTHGDSAFLLGSRLYPYHLSSCGQAIANAENLADMLSSAAHFHYQLFPFLFLRKAKTLRHQYLILNQSISMEDVDHYQFICELLVSLLVAIAKQKRLPLSRMSIRFPYSTPRHIEQYQAYLPCKFSFAPCATRLPAFNSSANCYLPLQIKFDIGLLKLPLANGNSTLLKHYLRQAPTQVGYLGFIQYIMQLMVNRVQQKQEVNADWLATHLNISKATLKRKLGQHNVSYQQLFDMVRQQQAIFLLTEHNFNNEKIAQDLNFSDTTNFRRSFKRWTGFTPQALKKAL